MITGERTYHRRKRFCDGLHIGILEVRLGADSDALAADDKGPSSPFLGVGRLHVLGFMLNCGARAWAAEGKVEDARPGRCWPATGSAGMLR